MRVALVGATGAVGIPLTRELVRRNHEVTAITIHPELVEPHSSVVAVDADANDRGQLVAALVGHDVVITSIQYRKTDHDELVEAVRESKVPRWFVNGGSGTLLAPGTDQRIMDGPGFPPAFAQSAQAAARFWERLEQETDLNWVYLSPPPGIGPGERTGRYRRGGRELLTNEAGDPPAISFDDYAIAIVDELERPVLTRERFTVAH